MQVFGRDIGLSYMAWCALYEKQIDNLPTPLTEAQDQDLKRVLERIRQYYLTFDQWIQFRDELYRTKIRASGEMDPMVRLMDKLRSLEASGIPRHELDLFFSEEDESLTRRIEALREQASEALRVAKPDWTVVTTDALVAEVDAYIERVWDAVERAGLVSDDTPTATRPATTRAAATASRPSPGEASSGGPFRRR